MGRGRHQGRPRPLRPALDRDHRRHRRQPALPGDRVLPRGQRLGLPDGNQLGAAVRARPLRRVAADRGHPARHRRRGHALHHVRSRLRDLHERVRAAPLAQVAEAGARAARRDPDRRLRLLRAHVRHAAAPGPGDRPRILQCAQRRDRHGRDAHPHGRLRLRGRDVGRAEQPALRRLRARVFPAPGLDAHRRARCDLRHRRLLRACDLAGGRRDDDRADRRRGPAEPHVRPPRGRPDDDGLHRRHRQRRRADRLDRVQDDLRRGPDAVRDDVRDEHRVDPAGPEVPRGLRVMAAEHVDLRSHDPGRQVRGRAFYALLLVSIAIGFVTLGALLVDVFSRAINWTGATVDLVLLLQPPSADPALAGARPAILATIYIGVLLLLFTVPIGVGTAIYLEEYANKERWYNRLLEVNIQNLAAVPSIVYGILGLAFLVRGIGLGRVLLAGAMILTLLVLPTVIIASREAIRAVPDSIRQGGYALGATPWQVVSRQVLPAAIPGIATGSILALC